MLKTQGVDSRFPIYPGHLNVNRTQALLLPYEIFLPSDAPSVYIVTPEDAEWHWAEEDDDATRPFLTHKTPLKILPCITIIIPEY